MSNVRPQLKVLIVDDSELNREMLGSMLGDEYEIVEAENGRKRLIYCVKMHPTCPSSCWIFKCRRWMALRY